MEILNWSNYSSTDFTIFCNALLTFEVSKFVTPFSAQGTDGGIDASFQGEYEGKSGLWRFQFKFYKVARKQAFNQLKSKLKQEIGSIGQEDFFVLITNVELLPQEFVGLQQTFTEQLNSGSLCKFLIWEGAKLQTLFLRHPLLNLWMDEGIDTAQLQDYKVYFKKELNTTETFEPYTLSNEFIARTSDLKKLEEFVDSQKVLAVVTGEAGIGKTRMVLEFFKQKIDVADIWTPLVLGVRNIDFDRLKKSLSSEKYFIILVDDAHNYKAEDIADLKTLAQQFDGRVKIILTARLLRASESLLKIKEYDHHEFAIINLSRLERPETKAAFEHYIVKRSTYSHYIGDLVEISHGRPILIVAILKAIASGTLISKIRADGFLKQYVNNYFDSFYEEIFKQTNISKLRVKRLLQNIALIEPFNFGNPGITHKLCEVHKIDLPELTLILDNLLKMSFVTGKYEQSIKPDYYGDIVLADISLVDAALYISEFNSLLDNIIVNLSGVDEVAPNKNSLLNAILQQYVNGIAVSVGSDNDRMQMINNILSTVGQIVFVNPKVGEKAIDLYLQKLEEENHPINIELRNNSMSRYQSAYTTVSKVTTLLSRLLSFEASYNFVFNRAFRLYNLSKDNKIFTLYSFQKRDAIDGFLLSRQQYFIDRLKDKDGILEGDFPFIQDVIKTMLSLDFTTSEYSAISRNSLSITTYYVPNNDRVKNFRVAVISLLSDFYILPQLASFKLEIVKLLIEVPRGIFASRRNNRPYINSMEFKMIFDFLEERAVQFDLLEQKEIFDKFYLFILWNIDEVFLPQIDRIKQKMTPKNLTEELSQIFTRAEINRKDYDDIREFMAQKCDGFVKEYSSTELAKSLYEFLQPQPYTPHYFWEFLTALQKRHISYAIVFHDYLLELNSPLYYLYASRILYSLRFEMTDHKEFWERVHQLQSKNTWEADNVILNTYSNRVPGSADILADDVLAIKRIFRKNAKENNYALASGLQTIIAAEDNESEVLVSEFLLRATQREAEMFFVWLTENTFASSDLISSLVLTNSIRFELSYEIERGLARVLKDFGIGPVFEYLKERFEYKKRLVIETKSLSGYEFLSSIDRSNLFDDNPEGKLEIYKKGLEWFVSLDDDGGHSYYAKDILTYLQPEDAISKDIFEIYITLINQDANRLDTLHRITESLVIFHQKNELLVSLVQQIHTKILDFKNLEDESYNYAIYALFNALTSVGVKSGTPGKPFQVDLDLRDLLQTQHDKLANYSEFRQLLQDALNGLNRDIERNSDKDDEIW